jgi:methylmalonyl-CoA mutase
MPKEVTRASEEEKQRQIYTLSQLHKAQKERATKDLRALNRAAARSENTFEQLMEASKSCSLGQITHALFSIGGQYRRNM